jgi:HK97 gp10 family phage protein
MNVVEIHGIDEFYEKLDGLLDGSKLKSNVGKACALVEKKAKEKAPKDTGALRRSIESKVEMDGNDIVGTVFTPLEYAPYICFGTGLFAEKGGRADVPWKYQDDNGEWHSTKGQKPQPFLRPAFNESREEITRLIREGLND